MASLLDIYFKEETLETLLKTVRAKKLNGVGITVSVNDETKHFKFDDGNSISQNVSAYVSQTKEDRDAKKPKYYVGNGKVFWTDGTITVAEKPGEESKPSAFSAPQGSYLSQSEESDDLPF